MIELGDKRWDGYTSRMGRPPLGMKPTTIRLAVETVQRIEALVGSRRLALFIREAIDNELARRASGLGGDAKDRSE